MTKSFNFIKIVTQFWVLQSVPPIFILKFELFCRLIKGAFNFTFVKFKDLLVLVDTFSF